MRRWHFYVMGLIALLFGVLSVAEYVLVSYDIFAGWLAFYPADQLLWLQGVPGWVHGFWAVHAVLALVGALCLLAHVRAAVWMLGFSFLSLVVLLVWAMAFADPTLPELVGGGWQVWAISGLVLVLSFLVYVYARQEKRVGENL
jgi:hypothetical protein